MNEYVSSYLEGVVNKAEYGTAKNTNDEIINFSGPIQKIMPQAMLDAQRMETINSAITQLTYTPESDEGYISTDLTTEPTNHNQTVVCASPEWTTAKAFGIIPYPTYKQVPYPCYANGNPPKKDQKKLKDWATGDLGVLRWLSDQIMSGLLKVPFVSQALINANFSEAWNYRFPPVPWGKGEDGKTFTSYVQYQKAYFEWEGQTCVILPVVNYLVCANLDPTNSLISSDWANLFPYIPLANTTDKHGSETDEIGVEFQPTGGTQISGQTFNQPKSAPLYFAHAEEDMELSSFLNSSYVPKGITGQAVPKSTETNTCNLVDVRVNPGDNLFPGKPHGIEVPGVSYTITAVPCVTTMTPARIVGGGKDSPPHPVGPSWETKCDAEIILTLPTFNKAPQVTQIWNTTVSDSESTFRRIYPEVGPGAPVSCIEDNPTKTGVTYTPIDPIGGGADNFKVTGPAGGNTTGDASLYFPHIGSIYDYFLKGIQTALRPKGFADPTPQSGTECSNVVKSTCDGKLFSQLKPPSSTTSQAHSYFETYIMPTLTPDLLSIYANAEKVTGVPCEILAGVHFEEADNNPKESLQNGGPLEGSLLDSAIQAGYEIEAKVGGKITNWNQAITALSRYNGGGNSNCGVASGYTGPCPPPEGIDDIYPTAWIDSAHLVMYLIYYMDGTKYSQYPLVIRPGALTVATELYNSETK